MGSDNKVKNLFRNIIGTFILIIMVLTIFIFVKPKPQEKVIKECFWGLYNIPDYKIYNQIMENIYKLSEDAHDKIKDEITEKIYSYGTREEMIKCLLFEYDKYCTKRGEDQIVCNGWHTLYRKAAYNKQFNMELKDIDLKKSFEFKDEKKIGYTFKATLLIDYVNSDKQETVYEEGYVNVVKVDNDWKIDSFRVREISDIFIK